MVSKSQLAIAWPVFRPRRWGQPAGNLPLPQPWYGLDTERDSESGEFVCGFAVNETAELPFRTIRDLPSGTYWVWNLAYDIEGMLRDLGVQEAWAAKSDGSMFPLLDGQAVYYHGKRFNFRAPNKRRLSFIEANSFFGRRPLSAIGAKENVDASRMSLTRYQTDPAYRASVDSYCKQDARIVIKEILKLANSVSGLKINLGATPGSTARRFVATLGQFPPVIWQTHKAFLRSYCGGRFEITKRGVIAQETYQHDIVSAYPWALANCPWLTLSAYSRITRRFSDRALYGSYLVGFKQDGYLGVAPRWRNGVRVYSKAEEKTWLARPELDWLLRNGVDVNIRMGVEIFDENATSLWRDVMERLFALKQKGKSEADGGWGAKIILNSVYGILIQLIRASGQWVPIAQAKNPIDFAGLLALEEPPKKFEAGTHYGPVYSGNLTSLTRCRILDAAEEIGEEDYIGGHTDSVLATKKLRHLGEELGAWKIEKTAPRADVCKTGMYALGDSVKVRGITRKGTAGLLWEDSLQRKTRIGIKSAETWGDVSVIVPRFVSNNYTIENKRIWHGQVTRGLIALERYIDSEAFSHVG